MNDFKDAEDLFPHWITCRIILKSWVESIVGFIVSVSEVSSHYNIDIALKTNLSLISLVPDEYNDLVCKIYSDAMLNYLPNLEAFYLEPISSYTCASINMYLTSHDCNLISEQKDIKTVMYKAFGIKDTKLHNIEFKYGFKPI